MLKATDYEILRQVRADGKAHHTLSRKPVRVATLIDEASFVASGGLLEHNKTVFLEDRVHDWTWTNGAFRYFTRVATIADVIIVYEVQQIEAPSKFDPMTGRPTGDASGS